MIFDIHTHTPTHEDDVPAGDEHWNRVARPDRDVKVTVSWAEYEHAAAEAEVDVSVVFNIAVSDPGRDTALPGDPNRINESTADFVAANPGRRIGFMSVHPDWPNVLDEIERCVADLGLKGIKLGPNYQNFDPLGDNAHRVYAEAERRGLPLLFHQGASPVRDAPLRYAHPLTIDEIAIRHPELRIVMAHMGHPWQADTIVTIRKHPHVYADVSALFYRPLSFYTGLRLATEWNVLSKLLLGSDYPIITPKETIDGLRNVNSIVAGSALPPVPLDALEEIIQRDSLSLLGLEDPPRVDHSVTTIAALETCTVSLTADPELAVHGARGSHTESIFTLVRVSMDDGVEGYGEVSATPGWSGEDDVTAQHLIRDVLRPALVGERLGSVPALTARMDKALAGNPFTKAGVNMALWDALGRGTGRRVAELLGGPFRTSVPVKMSLSGDGDRLVGCLEAIRRRGFTAFKVKVGLDLASDIERFALARELVGAETFLGADANGGWTRAAAAAAAPRLADLGAAFMEQPVRPDDVAGLALLRGRGLPIVADESVFSLGDVVRIIREEAADTVSIYVGKSGSLERAVTAVTTLDLFGLDAVIGSNGEMGLGAAAQIHVGCACERLSAIPSDIIGHHFYNEDILATPVPIDGRHAHLPDGPGLGVEPAAEHLSRFS